jgi:hypothetical protein
LSQRQTGSKMSRNSRNRRRRARMKASRANECRGESCQHRTLAAIKEYFESQGLYVFEDPENGRLALDLTFYPPERVSYRNENGEAACQVIVDAYDEGFVMIASPAAWKLRECPNRAAVYETLVRETPELPIIRFQHDPESDGVSPFAVVPIGDWGVSGEMIMKIVASVIDAILRWDSAIQRAVAAGVASVPSFYCCGDELSPAEEHRILHGLGERLTDDIQARWESARQDFVEKAGSDGIWMIAEEPESYYLKGTAAIVHGSRVLGLTRTLHDRFERAFARAMAKKLGL